MSGVHSAADAFGTGEPAVDARVNQVMDDTLAAIAGILTRLERLAGDLRADPDGHVRRSAHELREAFATRAAIEPAVARMRSSLNMLRQENRGGRRREFQRRALGLDHLDEVVQQELLPRLRRLGFDV